MLANLIGGASYQKFGGFLMYRGAAIVMGVWTLVILGYHFITRRQERAKDNDIVKVEIPEDEALYRDADKEAV